jgi:hypothetical protein
MASMCIGMLEAFLHINGLLHAFKWDMYHPRQLNYKLC